MIEIVVIPKDELIEIIRTEINNINLKREKNFSDIMTLPQLCCYLNTTPPTVNRRIKSGLPVSYALGEKSPRFIKSEIDQWLMSVSGRGK